MKKYLLIGALLFTIPNFACDTCSGSMGLVDNGAFQLERNYVGIVWSFLSQRSNYASFENEIQNKIRIHQMGLMAGFNFKEKYNISVAVPSFVAYSKSLTSFSLGDPMVNFRYRIYKNAESPLKPASHILYGNFGVKIPFGVFVNQSLNQIDNINFSTKTVDFILGAQYIYTKKNKGINLSFNSRLNTSDKSKNSIGHGFVLRTLLFANKDFNKSMLSLFAGLSGEYNMKEISNGYKLPFSGGKALYLTLGGNLNVNNFISVMINPELPLVQDYRIQNGTIFTNLRINLNTKILF